MKTPRSGESRGRHRVPKLRVEKTKRKRQKSAKAPVLSWAAWLRQSFHEAAPLEWLPSPYQTLLKNRKAPGAKRILH